jgi:YD repeat-containing protein
VAGSISWSYDNDFAVVSESVPCALAAQMCQPITFGYDPDKLLTSAGALTLTRDPQNGLLTGTTLGGVTEDWTYNAFGEPASYAVNYNGTPLLTQQFTRDDSGRIVQATEAGTTTYGYDQAGRLTTVTGGSGSVAQYSYDGNSNRLTRTVGTGVENAIYDDQDRLLAYNGATYTYTAAGELATKTDASGTTRYVYDELGSLLKVTLPSGTVIEYVIDGQNRRVGKKVNGTLVKGWLYSDQLHLVAELDGTGAVASRFVYSSRVNVPDYMIKDETTIASSPTTSARRGWWSMPRAERSYRATVSTSSARCSVNTSQTSNRSALRAGCTIPTRSSYDSAPGTTTRRRGAGQRRIRSGPGGGAPICTSTVLVIL